ncbi:hypothetical protein L6V77_16730 [Myxococcota bacterium]|nr:hypothetical protein [Myxococcota bacterium]
MDDAEPVEAGSSAWVGLPNPFPALDVEDDDDADTEPRAADTRESV